MFNMTKEDAIYTLIGMSTLIGAIILIIAIIFAPKFIIGMSLGVLFVGVSYLTGQIIKSARKG